MNLSNLKSCFLETILQLNTQVLEVPLSPEIKIYLKLYNILPKTKLSYNPPNFSFNSASFLLNEFNFSPSVTYCLLKST